MTLDSLSSLPVRRKFAIYGLLVPFIAAGVSIAASAQDSLQAAYQRCFRVGVAINKAQVEGKDPRGEAIIAKEFNSISPENVLKWKAIHPKLGVYDFVPADAYVAFGEQHKMLIIGHTLVWHEAVPDWVFQDPNGKPLSRQALLDRMHEHILTIVGRYKGRIRGWDVVNEALADDGSLRDTPWRKIIGDDYVEKAFEFAHEADPDAELYYNDYLLEKSEKRRGALVLLAHLREKGIQVAAVGLQGHYSLEWPSTTELDAAITDFAKAGFKVSITELDVDVLPRANTPLGAADVKASAKHSESIDPYPDALPGRMQQALATRYADLFRVLIAHPSTVERVTFWGVTDANSWLNNWPVKGRTNYPLLFDRTGKRKPAYEAVINVANEARANK